MCGRNMCQLVAILITFAVGIALIVCGIVIPNYIQNQVDSQVADLYVPNFGTSSFTQWSLNDNSDSAIEYQIFKFFNITNPHDVLYNAATAIVEEVGPFVYQTHRRKLFVNTSVPGQATFYLQEFYSYVTEPVSFINPFDGSTVTYVGLDPNTTFIYSIDPVLFGAMHQIYYNPLNNSELSVLLPPFCYSSNLSPLACLDLFFTLRGQNLGKILDPSNPKNGLLPNRSVSEWLGLDPAYTLNSTVLQAVNLHLLSPPQSDCRFGFWYNTSQYDVDSVLEHVKPHTIHFDRNDLSKANSYVAWEGHTVLHNFRNTTTHYTADLNVMNYDYPFAGWGEDIDFLNGNYLYPTHSHPNLDKSDNLTFWQDDGARPILTTFYESVSLEGVDAYHYSVSSDIFAPNPIASRVFFSTIPGIANESQWKSYAPVMVSYPHFYEYENLVNIYNIQGMPPSDINTDRTYILVEPHSGVVISVAQRLQINAMIPDVDFQSLSPPLPYRLNSTLVPVFTTERRSQLTDSNASDLKKLQLAYKLKPIIFFVGTIAGAALTSLAIFLLVVKWCRREKATGEYQPLYHPSN